MSPIRLSAQGLAFSFNHKPIVDAVDLDIQPGEMLGLIGPNGAGKSTLIKLLSRVLTPLNGRVWLGDSDLSTLNPSDIAKRIAVVPQVFELPAGFTAFEIVMMGRTPHLGLLQTESAHDVEVARSAMEATGTLDLAKRLVSELSGGERQRVVIARALAQEPAILLLDESTAHLDVAHQIEVMDIIRRLKQERALAVLSVFHDLNLAAQYCDRIAMLKDGRVVAIGSPGDVMTQDALRTVYGVDMYVFPHPRTHLPAALIWGKGP